MWFLAAQIFLYYFDHIFLKHKNHDRAKKTPKLEVYISGTFVTIIVSYLKIRLVRCRRNQPPKKLWRSCLQRKRKLNHNSTKKMLHLPQNAYSTEYIWRRRYPSLFGPILWQLSLGSHSLGLAQKKLLPQGHFVLMAEVDFFQVPRK